MNGCCIDVDVKPETHKSREVVVDALGCQPLAELGLFLQQLVLHLVELLGRARLVVAPYGRIRGHFKLPVGAHKHLLVDLLWRQDLT